MLITSTDNKKIKEIRKLKNNKHMMNEKKFIVEGEHLVEEAKKEGLLLEVISTLEKDYGVYNTIVTQNVMDSISNLPSKPSVIGICKFILENKNLGNKIIILDGVQDPGNLGTIIRSSVAFGFDTVVLSSTCVKKYNEKVIRSTQGMLFKQNVITKDLLEFIPLLKDKGYKIYGTDVVNGTNVKEVKKSDKVAVIMGSEGLGISGDVKNLIDENIYITMSDNCESLNVAVAASIIMHDLTN